MESMVEHHPEMVKPPSDPSPESPPKSLCLSAALESLPLVYLPETKQLVTAPWPRNPDLRTRAISSTSPAHARASCYDLPTSEFPFSDDCSCTKNLAGSKISEDSGYPGLWDSDASLSREAQSERNSSICSGEVLECDIEGDIEEEEDVSLHEGGERDEAFSSPVSSCGLADVPNPPSSSCFSANDSSAKEDGLTKDLQGLSVTTDSVATSEGTSLDSAAPGNTGESGAGRQTAERTRKGTFASFFTSTLFGGKGKSQQELTPTGNQSAKREQKQESSKAASSSPSRRLVFKKSDVEKSTTALILQPRPQGLPSKDPEEEARHRHLYQTMVEEAKQKECRDAKRQKQRMKEQLKYEAATATALRIWTNDILPNWETVKNSKRVRDLWWNGIPPRIRGRVWQMAIGNELNITAELYEICLVRAKERLRIPKDTGSDTDSLSSFTESTMSRESSVELIRLDVSRTFPNLCIFQKGGPYHDLLQGLLGSYACYRPDVGYVQGMSFIAAMLLLNMEVAEAFVCFANLLNKPCLLAFFRLDRSLMDSYFETFDEFFHENLPQLHQHLQERNLTPDLYLLDWLFTLYTKSLSLDVVSRVWDIYFRDGEEFLFRTALGILKLYEDILLNLDFIQLAQFLTRLPSDVSCEDLFRCTATVSTEIDKRQFAQVLAQHCDSRTA